MHTTTAPDQTECDANNGSFRSLVDEFRTVREATVTFFHSLPEDA